MKNKNNPIDTQHFGDVSVIYAVKGPCPFSNGYFICDECLEASDAFWRFYGCGEEVDGKACGEHHFGYDRCDDCKRLGRSKHSHIGEFVAVDTVKSRG